MNKGDEIMRGLVCAPTSSAAPAVLPPLTPIAGLDVTELMRALGDAQFELQPYLDQLAQARRAARRSADGCARSSDQERRR